MKSPQVPRLVFDTNTVLSALVFTHGRLAWLRSHWMEIHCVPLISRATAVELARVFSYPKFRLSPDGRLELLGDYLPFCENVLTIRTCPITCRDPKDQMFLDLAQCGSADILVRGDEHLLVLASEASFVLETPEAYRERVLRG